jgi:fatty-acid desaturase
MTLLIWSKIADLARYPELIWLHKHELVPPFVLALVCYAIGDWPGLIVGFFWSTVLVYHATFCINSLAHVRGRRNEGRNDKGEAGSTVCASYNSGAVKSAASVSTASKSLI